MEPDPPAVPAVAPARFWTLEEANGRISGLAEVLPALRAGVVRLRKVHDELHRLAQFWGKELNASDHPDRPLRDRLQEEWVELTRRLESDVARLREEGIEVKDLESGLVDFYAHRGSEVIFLCWRRGEESVGYFHTLEGGFKSRRPIAELDVVASPSPHGAR